MRNRLQASVFSLSMLIIVGVAAIDTYLNIKYPVRSDIEHNPLAAMILKQSQENLALLISMKLIGTVIVMSFLTAAYFFKATYALVIALTLALLQVCVLCYLMSH